MPFPSGLQAVIFDMDGVLFDSERAVYDGWRELAEKYGFKDLDTPYMQCIGVNAAICRRIFLDFYGPDFPYDAYTAERSRRYHEKYDHGNLPLKPGVTALLTTLRQAGIRTAVASSTRSGLVRDQIQEAGLLPFFDTLVGGDMVTRSKPDPEIFLEAAGRLGVPPGRCCVIEDSYNGILAADRAGMAPVMVPDMLPPNEEMRRKARCILPSLEDVRTLFLDLQGLPAESQAEPLQKLLK